MLHDISSIPNLGRDTSIHNPKSEHRAPNRIASARRSVAFAVVVIIGALSACSGDQPIAPTSPSPSPSPPRDRLQALDIVTYDGSGQSVHPDFAAVPTSWNGTADRLVLTPYPEGNARFENPSLYASTDGATWIVPDGVINPLVAPGTGYLSDPDVVFDPETAELLVYYRQVTGSENEIWLIRSSDGVHWSAPTLVAHAPNHEIISPTVVRRGHGDWLMWAVDAGSRGCTSTTTTVQLRRSTDGVHWSTPEQVRLGQTAGFAWHLDVEWIASRHEFWALFPVKQAGGCTTATLYLATSPDGVQWTTRPTPVLSHGAIPEFQNIVYRSTLAYDDASNTVTLWYSGARFEDAGFTWRIAREQLSADALMARVSMPAANVTPPTAATPQLTNATAP